MKFPDTCGRDRTKTRALDDLIGWQHFDRVIGVDQFR